MGERGRLWGGFERWGAGVRPQEGPNGARGQVGEHCSLSGLRGGGRGLGDGDEGEEVLDGFVGGGRRGEEGSCRAGGGD